MSFLGSVVRLSMSSEKPVRSLLILLCHTLISVSGFGYSFHSLPSPGTDPHGADKTDEELAYALATMFSIERQFSVLTILVAWFPFLRRLVRGSLESNTVCPLMYGLQRPQSRAFQRARTTMQRIGTQLINERKVAHSRGAPKYDTPPSRDILSVLGTHLCFRLLF